MKKITVSIVAAFAMSTFVFAGGNIAPVEPEVVSESTPGNFYVGLAYSYMDWNGKDAGWEADTTGNAISLIGGYDFNQYVAIEGRYTVTVGDLHFKNNLGTEHDVPDNTMSNIGIYLKPMLPFEQYTLYGLIGYGHLSLEDHGTKIKADSFQWGIGASYDINENTSLFVDYIRFYDDTGIDVYTGADYTVDALSVGVTYSF